MAVTVLLDIRTALREAVLHGFRRFYCVLRPSLLFYSFFDIY